MKKKLLSTGLIAALCLTSALLMTSCGEEQPYSDYDLSEYVKVGNYKGLEYEKTTASVSEKAVQEEIDRRLSAHAVKEEVKEGAVQDGETVNIDYTGTMDGKKFDGGSAKGQNLTIGSGSFIDGFEDGLIGKEVGETVTLDLEFPDPYQTNPDLAGKPVTFEVKINSRQVEKTPEYNMDFVKEYYSEYDSLKAFEAGVQKDLLKAEQERADLAMKQKLWEEIVKNSEVIQYPEEKDAMNEEVLASYKQIAKDEGMEWEEYLDAMGVTEKEISKNAAAYAEGIVKEEMILYSIAETEGIEVTDQEYEEYLDELLKGSGMDEKTFESTLGRTVEQYAEDENLRSAILLNKVMDKVVEYGKAV